MDGELRHPSSNLVSTFPPALVATVTRGPGEGSSHGEEAFLRSLCLQLDTGLAVSHNTIVWFKLD